MDFVHDSLARRIVFGPGRLRDLGAEIDAIGARRVLLVTSKRQRPLLEPLVADLGGRVAGVFDDTFKHVRVETQRAAVAAARDAGAECTVTIGGGSVIGIGKAVAVDTGLPVIAVPTTYSGSEMTPIYGLTEDGLKRTARDLRVMPVTVIYDPELTVELPAAVGGPSGMNAIAHAVEALYAENENPITTMMAEEAIGALADGLAGVAASPIDMEARSLALYGACLSGAALASVGMAIHHKLCHALGGGFDLPHAEVHTIVLPHAVAYNQGAAAPAMGRIARALGALDAAQGLYDLAQALGAKMALRDIGMKEKDLDRAAEIATTNPYYNPRPVTVEGVRELLDDAFRGIRPQAIPL
ncbi:MAG: maleylacetate reductase [Rhodospirillales bacterium]|nr:maleylacetate reductase [Rhodospirillales bacterium]MDP6774519.1 maleylacetate reductase [Rhodospirillales bacterium]